MDIITQGVLGAAAAQLVSSKNKLKLASIAGFVGGLMADADMIITSKSNPIIEMVYHRNFTHSLSFIPVGAAITALLICLIAKVFQKNITFKSAYWPAFAGYATHGILDTCTSYGTMLLWPFSNQRISWDCISIIDPIYTGLLIIGCLLTLAYKQRKFGLAFFVLSLIYMGIGVFQHDQAENIQIKIAAERGQIVERGRLFPTLGNLVLWRSVYLADGKLYMDAIKTSPWKTSIIVGESISALELDEALQNIPSDSKLAKNIKTYYWFTDNWVARLPNDQDTLGDMRYSMIPNSITPIWALKTFPDNPDRMVEEISFRDEGRKLFNKYLEMILE